MNKLMLTTILLLGANVAFSKSVIESKPYNPDLVASTPCVTEVLQTIARDINQQHINGCFYEKTNQQLLKSFQTGGAS